MSTVDSNQKPSKNIVEITDPPFTRALFGDVRFAWIWLILRLYAGWEWLAAGWGKINSPAWTGSQAGTALTGFLNNALTKSTGEHPDVQGWYAWFLEHLVLPNAVFWSYVVAWGEFIVGIALIIGIFTGIAAFFGTVMNANYLLAGTVSTNPILLTIGIFLVLAWKVSGWWGLDRWVLPALGTPWRPGYIFKAELPGIQPDLPPAEQSRPT